MKTILITGCNGYIGLCISAYLKNKFFIIGVDKKKNLFKNKHINVEYNINLNNFKFLSSKLDKHKIDLIIHLAGESTLDNINNKNDYYVNNVLATKNLIKISSLLKIKNIIFSSTAAVYAGGLKLLSENSKIDPKNIYGKTKLICEKLIKKEFGKKNKSYVIFRFFNVCSSYLEKKVGEMHAGSRALLLERSGDDFKIKSPKDKSVGWVNSIQIDKTLYQNPKTYEECKE